MRFNRLSVVFIAVVLTLACGSLKKHGEIKKPALSAEAAMDSTAMLAQLAHFPAPRTGYQRYVIFCDSRPRGEYRIEIIPGKTIMADCNRYSLSGSISEKTLEGWGYAYYEFTSDGQVLSTRMACPDYTPAEKFISGETLMVSNNPELPVVVYVPSGIIVKYRVWDSSPLQTAKVK